MVKLRCQYRVCLMACLSWHKALSSLSLNFPICKVGLLSSLLYGVLFKNAVELGMRVKDLT